MEKLFVPFTPTQVQSLLNYQNDERTHEYTCTNGHTLTPTELGWICASCPTFRQTWALLGHASGWVKTPLLEDAE